MTTLLQVEDLQVTFHTETDTVHAVRGVGFAVESGQTLGIVGESGSGKSACCQAIMGLTPANGTVRAARLAFRGVDLLGMPEARAEGMRGRDMAMVFQEPMTSLNPVHTIGRQVAESLVIHRDMRWGKALDEAADLLALVGIPEPRRRLRAYPHQLSGGMCQRAMIAMALACQPALLFADEPTTALDVTVQAQILELLRRLRDELQTAIVLITHDLAVVAEMADTVVVMRSGQVVESGTVKQVLEAPGHAYTRELLASVPRLDRPSPVYRPPAHGARG